MRGPLRQLRTGEDCSIIAALLIWHCTQIRSLGESYMDPLTVAHAASEAFRKIDPQIATQTISVLLTVAQHNGRIIVSDLERLCGLTRESASRNVDLLSHRKLRDGRHGYGLVEKRNNDVDQRTKTLYLTRCGEQMINTITSAIEEAQGGRKR